MIDGVEAAEWTPVVDGTLQRAALQKVAEIASTLCRPGAFGRGEFDLARGAAGVGLALDYFHRAFPDRGFDEASDTCIESSTRALAELTPSAFGLYQGYAGVGWVVEHVVPSDLGEQDPNDDIDALLAEVVAVTPWPRHFDLIDGLVGIGEYALERGDRASARLLTMRIVERLDELTESYPGPTVTWRTRPSLLPPSKLDRFPEGLIDLGVAHGVPGVIAYLAKVSMTAHDGPVVRRLLERGLAWLLAKGRGRNGAFGCYWHADRSLPEDAPPPAAWCYGHPGIAAALALAARAMHDEELDAIALELLRSELREDARVVGASFCHGAAGLLHIATRFWNETRDPSLRDCARTLVERTLAMATSGVGIAGYDLRLPHGDGPAAGFLDGAAGIGLALLSAASHIEPAWDRALLLSARVE